MEPSLYTYANSLVNRRDFENDDGYSKAFLQKNKEITKIWNQTLHPVIFKHVKQGLDNMFDLTDVNHYSHARGFHIAFKKDATI